MLTVPQVEDALLTGSRLPPRSFADVPTPGVYAWWDARGALSRSWPEKFAAVDPARPLYVGNAMVSLADRGVLMHLQSTRVSSLRRSLASLLFDQLDLLPGARAHPERKFTLEHKAEERLTRWMEAHLTVVTVVHPSPGAVECAVIASILPPLHDKCAQHGPYWRAMDHQRAESHRRISID